MANIIKWGAQSSFTWAINDSATAPTLKGLANNGQKLGNAYDNNANRNMFAAFQLWCKGASAFTANTVCELYILSSTDGSTYADGSDTIAPGYHMLVGVFPLRAVATAQLIILRDIPIPPLKFKPLLINRGGQAFTNVDTENHLLMWTYNPEVQ